MKPQGLTGGVQRVVQYEAWCDDCDWTFGAMPSDWRSPTDRRPLGAKDALRRCEAALKKHLKVCRQEDVKRYG